MERRTWSPLASLLFGLLVLAWGGNYLFVRLGELYVNPLWLAALRAGVGALGIGAFLAFGPATARLDRAERAHALLLGVPNTAVFLGLWFSAASSIAPGVTAVVVYTFPLWVALFSPFVLGSRLGPRHWAAVGLGFSGIVLVSQPWAASTERAALVPLLELLVAAVSWAAATVAFQRRFPPEKLPQANGYQLLGGAVVLLAASVLTGEAGLRTGPWPLLASVLWLGLFGTAFAYAVWFHLLRVVHASALSAYAFLVPLTALALSVALEGERLAAAQLGGVVLVLVGIYLVGARPPDVRRRTIPGAPGRA